MVGTQLTAENHADWEQILTKDEALLWVGQPEGGIRFNRSNVAQSIFGLFFLGFSLFWTAGAFFAVFSGFVDEIGIISLLFPLFGLPFIAVGFWLVFGVHIWQARNRKHSRYALTNMRAIITSWAQRREIKSFPIRKDTLIDYYPGDEATIYFATEVSRDGDGDRVETRVGFEHFTDGERAYQTILKIQAEQAE